MPLHIGRTVFIKIGSSRGNGIFGVGTVWEFTAALKNCTSTVRFHHGLQHEWDDFWVQIAANQHFACDSYKRHVMRRDIPLKIDHTLRQYQSNEFWEYDRESFRRWKVHDPSVGILQQGMDSRRIRWAKYPHCIRLAII